MWVKSLFRNSRLIQEDLKRDVQQHLNGNETPSVFRCSVVIAVINILVCSSAHVRGCVHV